MNKIFPFAGQSFFLNHFDNAKADIELNTFLYRMLPIGGLVRSQPDGKLILLEQMFFFVEMI
jgi:hypothetical protein